MGSQTFSFMKMPLEMSSAKWRPFCLGLNVLKGLITSSIVSSAMIPNRLHFSFFLFFLFFNLHPKKCTNLLTITLPTSQKRTRSRPSFFVIRMQKKHFDDHTTLFKMAIDREIEPSTVHVTLVVENGNAYFTIGVRNRICPEKGKLQKFVFLQLTNNTKCVGHNHNIQYVARDPQICLSLASTWPSISELVIL